MALATGWLTFTYLGSANHAPVRVAARTIVVAQRDIPARATITADMLALAQRPADAVDPGSISLPASALGSIARVTIPAGSAVTAAMIGRQFDVGVTARIPKGMRAISIPIDRVKGVANLMQAGDHVDVIALTRPTAGVAPRALTILKDVIVLAVGGNYETTDTGATPSPQSELSTATLAVTPRQADLLALADVNTTLRLALRQPQEPAGSGAVDPLILPVPPLPAVGRNASPQRSAPARTHSAVEVIDGDEVAGGQ